MQFTARFLSYLFHPLFTPLVSMYILFQLPIYINYKTPEEFMYFIYGIIVLNLILTPVIVSFYLKKKGVVSSLEMPTAKERTLPYLISSLFYIFTYFLFLQIDFPLLYLSIFKAATIVVILLLLFSLAGLKISAHLAGMGGICGMIFMIAVILKIDMSILLIFFVLLSGFVASSRYALKAHSFRELLIGFCLGFGMQLIVLY